MKIVNRKNRQNPPHTISIVYFLQTRLFTDKFSRTTTINPGIFRGRALWADSVSPRMNTIASRDHFKPITAHGAVPIRGKYPDQGPDG